MGPHAMVGDPFDVLGVGRDATAPEIKRAYFRLVREHGPETDPEMFQRIRAAYELLSDPDRRAEYISRADHGSAIEQLLVEMEKAWEAERYAEVVGLLRRALVLAPHAHQLYERLALAHYRLERPDEALATIERWRRADPDSLEPLRHRGLLHAALAKTEGSEDGDADLARAIADFETIIERAPHRIDAYFALADCHERRGDDPAALEVLLRALRVDSATEASRFEAHFHRCGFLVRRDRREELTSALSALEEFLAGEDANREFAASRFIGLSYGCLEERNIAAARLAGKVAKRLAPRGGEARAALDDLAEQVHYCIESEKIAKLERVPPPLRAMVEILARRPWLGDETAQEEWSRNHALLFEHGRGTLRPTIAILLEKCPRFSAACPALLREIHARSRYPFEPSQRTQGYLIAIIAMLFFVLLGAIDGFQLGNEKRLSSRWGNSGSSRVGKPEIDFRFGEFIADEPFEIRCTPTVLRGPRWTGHEIGLFLTEPDHRSPPASVVVVKDDPDLLAALTEHGEVDIVARPILIGSKSGPSVPKGVQGRDLVHIDRVSKGDRVLYRSEDP